MQQQLQRAEGASPQGRVVAVSDPDGNTGKPGYREIQQGKALKGVEVDQGTVPFLQKTEKTKIVGRAVQAAGQLRYADPGLPQRRRENALPKLFHHKLCLQPGPIHVQQHPGKKRFDPAGFPALTDDADPARHKGSFPQLPPGNRMLSRRAR